MLSRLLTKDFIQFSNESLSWEDAISLSAQPLLEQGKIENCYIEAMINKVKEFGPFINLGQGIALPHARPDEGVKEFGMSVLKLQEPVSLLDDEEQRVDLLFCLAASDNQKHLEALSALTKLLSNKQVLKQLKDAETIQEFLTIIKTEEVS
ncbi:PTS sugar transporter subunit IIA [Streptococcus sobrinus]|uniref:Ascorbate-specific PTS system EIIA component n=1 Tax=Streptococcus sobrinus TaxID=1310 RepID=A0ABM6W4L1_9STRE|nr:PTS sugar transporter subunit IIA [Streptococcus sobrinus]EMP71722.1 putative galactitol operon regulator [Streptococcus sobrinus DSM 20742 = ATCC 33478]SQG12867.1 PTS system transporter subunit IIA [Streptococcus sobrinus]